MRTVPFTCIPDGGHCSSISSARLSSSTNIRNQLSFALSFVVVLPFLRTRRARVQRRMKDNVFDRADLVTDLV